MKHESNRSIVHRWEGMDEGEGIMVVLLFLTAVMCLSEPYLLTVDMWHRKPFSNKITDAYKTKPVVDA